MGHANTCHRIGEFEDSLLQYGKLFPMMPIASTRDYLCCLIVHDLLCRQVTLVAHKQLVHVLIGISVNFVEPLLDIVETLLVCHIIDNLREGALSALCMGGVPVKG